MLKCYLTPLVNTVEWGGDTVGVLYRITIRLTKKIDKREHELVALLFLLFLWKSEAHFNRLRVKCYAIEILLQQQSDRNKIFLLSTVYWKHCRASALCCLNDRCVMDVTGYLLLISQLEKKLFFLFRTITSCVWSDDRREESERGISERRIEVRILLDIVERCTVLVLEKIDIDQLV